MGHSGDTTRTGSQQSRDPFAPPPVGTPDRPWQPRGPIAQQHQPPQDAPEERPGDEEPQAGTPGGPDTGAAPEDPSSRGRAQVPPPHPWSPGYQGQQPPLPRFYPPPPGPRFDPTDPVQRRARYALLSGMWGFLFLILGIPYLTLLLGACALYWGISALRGQAKAASPAQQAVQPAPQFGPQSPGYPPYYPQPTSKPQAPAAIGGLIAGTVSLALVAALFGFQLYYKSFFDCRANALTNASYNACATSVTPTPPAWLVQINTSG
jgi:hypothetical protein